MGSHIKFDVKVGREAVSFPSKYEAEVRKIKVLRKVEKNTGFLECPLSAVTIQLIHKTGI